MTLPALASAMLKELNIPEEGVGIQVLSQFNPKKPMLVKPLGFASAAMKTGKVQQMVNPETGQTITPNILHPEVVTIDLVSVPTGPAAKGPATPANPLTPQQQRARQQQYENELDRMRRRTEEARRTELLQEEQALRESRAQAVINEHTEQRASLQTDQPRAEAEGSDMEMEHNPTDDEADAEPAPADGEDGSAADAPNLQQPAPDAGNKARKLNGGTSPSRHTNLDDKDEEEDAGTTHYNPVTHWRCLVATGRHQHHITSNTSLFCRPHIPHPHHPNHDTNRTKVQKTLLRWNWKTKNRRSWQSTTRTELMDHQRGGQRRRYEHLSSGARRSHRHTHHHEGRRETPQQIK